MRVLMTLIFSVFLGFIGASSARAEMCTTLEMATETSTCVVMRLKGVRGVWMPLERSEVLRKEHLEYPELKIQIQKLETALTASKEGTALYQSASKERAEAMALLDKQLEASMAREAAAHKRADAWYRSPFLWFASGVGVVLIATVSVSLAAR